MAHWRDIHDFWFGEYQESEKYLKMKMPFWFKGSKETDEIIRSEYLGLIELYEQGIFPWCDWKSSPKSFLSLIILFDQFPRNIFRDDARSYGYDTLSLSLSREFMGRGWLDQLQLFEKLFVLLPFEHSESLFVQKESVSYFHQLRAEGSSDVLPFIEMAIQFAEKHKEVIERFGRYPHRNSVLGRSSTSQEQQFLESKEIVF